MLYDSKERKNLFPNKQVRLEQKYTKGKVFQSPIEYYEENGTKNNSYRTLMWYKEKYPKEFDSYLKIGMCRNPYDRLVSWWFACKELNYPEGNKSMKDWLIHRKGSNHLKYYEDENGKCLLDRVIRFEHRDEDIKKIFVDELGITDLKIDFDIRKWGNENNINFKKVEKKHYSYYYYYDDKLLDLLHSFPRHKKI